MSTNVVANYGYCKKGEKFRMVDPKVPINISGIAAISEEGILGFTFKIGSTNQDEFLGFLIMLMNKNEYIRKNPE